MTPRRITTAALLAAVLCLGVAARIAAPTLAGATGASRTAAPHTVSSASAGIARSASASDAASMRASALNRGGVPTRRADRIRKGHVIVRLKGALTTASLKRAAKSADTSIGAASVLHGNTVLWRVPAGVSEDEFATRLSASDNIAYAEPDYNRQLAYTPPLYTAPNEPAYLSTAAVVTSTSLFPYAQSWWLRDIKAPEMWKQAYTGPNVVGKYPLRASGTAFKVAVLDTGLWPGHPDAENIVPGWDFYSNDGDVTPPEPASILGLNSDEQIATASHGTDVAGLIGATVGNNIGSFGSGYDTQVVMYKVAGVNAQGVLEIPDSVIIAAIDRAVDDGCKIINMSIAGADDSQAMRDAINAAHQRGVVLVAAAGNNSLPALEYPAGWPNVVGVGALTKTASGTAVVRAPFSDYGTAMDLSAPGDQIWGLTRPGFGENSGGYSWWRGTSMASPIVAGGLAVLWRAVPEMSGDEIVSVAKSSATDVSPAGWDVQSGWGELNVLAAYMRLTTSYPLLKAPAISIPTTPSVRATPISWSAVPGYQVRYNVKLDGTLVAAGLATTGTILPAVTRGTHTVTVTPFSTRNWVDSTAVASRTVAIIESLPVMTGLSLNGTLLSWKSTESLSAGASYLLSLDGTPAVTTRAVSLDVSALALGMHSVTLRVVDPGGITSAPLTLVFRRWPPPSVIRVSGLDRYATNAALATTTFTTAKTVVLVGGENWPDGLSAGPLASRLGGPVLVTQRDSLPVATRSALTRLKTTGVVIVGGSASVSDAVVRALHASGLTVSRVWGRDRYGTANAVAREIWHRDGGQVPDATTLVVSGLTPQDALVASTVGARKGWPVLLTPSTSLPEGLSNTLLAIGARRAVVVGTTAAVSNAVLAKLPTATRIAGADAPSTSVAVANWARANYPRDFLGERYWVASSASTSFADSLGIGAAAGHTSGLLLLTPKTLASSVAAYYRANKADAAVNTVVGGTAVLPNTVVTAIKQLVGAP